MSTDDNYQEKTKLVHAGRDPRAYHGVVNPPIIKTSTILYENMAAYKDPNTTYRYGRMGNPLSAAFEEAMTELEGGFGAVSTSSGLASITTTLHALLKAGDHVLLVDGCYPPTRFFALQELARFGIEVEFYDPMIGAGIADLIKANTALIYMESPCSATFEVQDVPAIVSVAKERGVITVIDNTYSAGVLFKPLSRGVDVSVQSAAKYIGGHSDINLGVAVASTESLYKKIKKTAVNNGMCAAPDELYLALRGLRSVDMRLKEAAINVRPILDWFKARSEVQKIYSPLIDGHAGADIFARDYRDSNGLLSVLFKPEYSFDDVARFVDLLKLFPIGSSWGGYESLIQPQDLSTCRNNWCEKGILIRFQIGMEDIADLIADLEQAIVNI